MDHDIKLEAAIRNLAPEDLKPLKAMMQTTEGQVSLDVERLMGSEDRSLQIMLKDADGTMSAVTTEVPTRPRFLGAVLFLRTQRVFGGAHQYGGSFFRA